jgi:hypothetical protein
LLVYVLGSWAWFRYLAQASQPNISLLGSSIPNKKYILKIKHEDTMKSNTKIHMIPLERS